MTKRAPLVCLASVLAANVVPARSTLAQSTCEGEWLPGPGVAGIAGLINAMTMWDPDGPGPAQSVIVVAGSIESAAGVLSYNVVTWDPSSGRFSRLGSLGPPVRSLLVTRDGELIAAAGQGTLTVPEPEATKGVARYTNSGWVTVGESLGGTLNALAELPDGSLVAGGSVLVPGDVTEYPIMRWTNGAWTPTSMPGLLGTVNALAVFPDGTLVAGGNIRLGDGTQSVGIAAWTGAEWVPLGSGLNAQVRALQVMPDGSLLVGGDFTSALGSTTALNHVAMWRNLSWQPLGSGVPINVRAVARKPDGGLLAGGDNFSLASLRYSSPIWEWSGQTWTKRSSNPFGYVYALLPLGGDDALVGGSFNLIDGTALCSIARLSGESWSALAPGFSGRRGYSGVNSILTLPNGEYIAAGEFFGVDGVASQNIIRMGGPTPQTLAGGSGGGAINDLLRLPDGRIVAGGAFRSIGYIPAEGVAIWDGTSWQPMGSGVVGVVTTLARLPNGDIVAAGQITQAGGQRAGGIAKWDGQSWTPLARSLSGGTPPPSSIWRVRSTLDGGLLAAGSFTEIDGVQAVGVARWDGATWHPLGEGLPEAGEIIEMPNGDILAGSTWLARWDGQVWSSANPAQSSWVGSMIITDRGELVLCGSFGATTRPYSSRIARYAQGRWSFPDVGFTDSAVQTLTQAANGDIILGGSFYRFNGRPSVHLATWRPPPPPCNPADLTGISDPTCPDQQLTVDDVLVFVDSFSNATSCPGMAPCCPADLTGIGGLPSLPDGQLTVDDVILFVNAMGDGCDPR